MPENRTLFLAVDCSDMERACELASAISPVFGGIKLGLEFFMRFGADGVGEVMQAAAPGTKLFLDLKFHDIPNTVSGAVKNILALEPDFLTIHAAGGGNMIKAAVDAAAGTSATVLAVTLLTSLDEQDLTALGGKTVTETVVSLGRQAIDAGCGGLVCSPLEIASLRNELGAAPVLIVPGIRPPAAGQDDQKRVMTPADAFAAGASHLVIGRPVTQAADPVVAARDIVSSLNTTVKAA